MRITTTLGSAGSIRLRWEHVRVFDPEAIRREIYLSAAAPTKQVSSATHIDRSIMRWLYWESRYQVAQRKAARIQTACVRGEYLAFRRPALAEG